MRKLWIPLVVLVLASLACSLGGTPGATPQAGEGATAAPGGGESTGGAPALEVASDALSGLNSYRASITSQWTPTGGEPQGTTLTEEYTREPAAHRITMGSGQETTEIVQIGDTSWFCTSGQCAQTTQSEQDLESSLGALALNPADFTSDTDYTYVGEETVNDVHTRHYTLNLSQAQVALLSQGTVSDVHADIWVADQSGLPEFVVRYRMGWNETRTDGEGTVEYSTEVYDVNVPFTIEPPEGAAGMPEDLPAYPNASNLTIMEGFISFSTSDDVTTVADFYRTELATQGWTSTSDESLEGMVTQTWSKEGQNMTLMISAGGEGTSVVITLE